MSAPSPQEKERRAKREARRAYESTEEYMEKEEFKKLMATWRERIQAGLEKPPEGWPTYTQEQWEAAWQDLSERLYAILFEVARLLRIGRASQVPGPPYDAVKIFVPILKAADLLKND